MQTSRFRYCRSFGYGKNFNYEPSEKSTNEFQNKESNVFKPQNKAKKRRWILDGYMIMNKFELDIPEQASCITITGHNINDVFEDDMRYFSNLSELNLSDNNQVPMYKLKHLPNLSKLNLSLNKFTNLILLDPKVNSDKIVFNNLIHLNLSFNQLSFESLEQLIFLKRTLKWLDLSGNNLNSIPEEFKLFEKLSTLNLSNNSFKNTKENILCVTESDYKKSNQVCRIFDILCKIEPLKYLNLSNNSLKGIYIDQENYESVRDIFSNLVELDLSYNNIDNELDLIICVEFISIQLVDISGNPLTSKEEKYYSKLKDLLHKNISCHLRVETSEKPNAILSSINEDLKRIKINHSYSLPSLSNANIQSSFALTKSKKNIRTRHNSELFSNYPRPAVIKTKEFKRKKKSDIKIELKNAQPLTLKEIHVDPNEVFPPKEKNENKDNIFCGTRQQQLDQFQFFLTEQPSNRDFDLNETLSNRSVTKEYFDTLNNNPKDEEFLQNFFNKTKHADFGSQASNISNILGNENESQFLLNNPNANHNEYGKIKISTFKEWARLSLLDYDKQKSYNLKKMKPIK